MCEYTPTGKNQPELGLWPDLRKNNRERNVDLRNGSKATHVSKQINSVI